ncbi:hypothetical protein [Pseudomonas petrae]|uniref:hypothetical protein n=1 Tax=Pseudomonas petrae TaxID=2912190 RepID=UPI001F2D69F4|nr:hypothetical protein [Pseudomonas petrae]MCF7532009.1 hypothetical protein [Pseudomonas petrae]
MKTPRELCNKIEARLRVITGLAQILINNDSFGTGTIIVQEPQMGAEDSMMVHEVVLLLADQAQDVLVDLMKAMEVSV